MKDSEGKPPRIRLNKSTDLYQSETGTLFKTTRQPKACIMRTTSQCFSALHNDFMALFLVLFLGILLVNVAEACPNHQHDFREEGIGKVTISIRSTVKWITTTKKSLLAITLSSSKDVGASTITRELWVTSAVVVCSKCRMATGTVFMTLEQLKQVAAFQPALEPLLQKALAAPK